MEIWIPLVISGAFSIVVVTLGTFLIDRRERSKQEFERQNVANAAQRHAVAAYVKELRRANEQWRNERDAAIKNSSDFENSFAVCDALYKCLLAYRNAGTFLELELADPNVHRSFTEVDKEIADRRDYYAGLDCSSLESRSEFWGANPMSRRLEELILNLTKAAREHLH